MKNLYLFILLTTCTIFSKLSAQSCHSYIPDKIGSKWEVTQYNSKGKAENITKYELLDKTTSGSTVEYKIKAVGYDTKKKETFSMTVNTTCKNGKYSVDMKDIMDQSMFEAYKDLDVKIKSTEIEIPRYSTPVGTKLKDASVTMEVNAGILIKMKVSMIDRKVEAKEKKTTTAGTFNCIKISQKTVMTGVGKMESSSIDWYSENVGLVRSETYNKKGKLTGYSELTLLN